MLHEESCDEDEEDANGKGHESGTITSEVVSAE